MMSRTTVARGTFAVPSPPRSRRSRGRLSWSACRRAPRRRSRRPSGPATSPARCTWTRWRTRVAPTPSRRGSRPRRTPAASRWPGMRRRPRRMRPRDLRLPAVLDAGRPRHAARLQRPDPRRLLLRRRGREGQPEEAGCRTARSRPAGRAGPARAMTSVINAAHAKQRRVTLTLSVFAWTSGQAAVQKALLGSAGARQNLAGRPPTRSATGAPTGSTSTSSPSSRATRTSSSRSSGTMRAELDAVIPARPPLVRHARPPGQLPARAGPGHGRRRRRPRHGLRLPDRRRPGGRLDRPPRGSRPTTWPRPSGPTPRGSRPRA